MVVTKTGLQVVPLGWNGTTFIGAVAPYEITVVGSVTETVTNVNQTPEWVRPPAGRIWP